MPKISVIVCTYNRSEFLPGCLQSLVEQALESDFFEVIIVNNNSTDNTIEIASHFTSKYNNIRMIEELNQGLSHARNRGWQEAKGEYVAYIDDDALASSDWLYHIKSFIDRQPTVLAFGGPYTSYSLVSAPDWFPADYGSHSLGEEERPIVVGSEWISGTNMIFKKKLFYDIGGFNENLGMTGSNISYGEEINFFIKLNNRKIIIYYVPTIVVKHLIAEYKMKLSWLLLSAYKVGRCYNMTFYSERSFINCISNVIACLLVGINKYLNFEEKHFKHKIYVSFNQLFIEFGVLVDFFVNYKKINNNIILLILMKVLDAIDI